MAPAPVRRRPGFPAAVTIWEVGPRDGLQNERAVVPTEVKADLVMRLVGAGLRTVETTSFVKPSLVPQLADAERLFSLIERSPGVRLPALVPNRAGLDRALSCDVRDICVFASATESFARRNLNRTVEGALAMFAPVVAGAKAAGLGVRAYVSMCFGDPWEGAVAPERVVAVSERLLGMGCDQVSLGDTIGVATTGQVIDVLERMERAGVGTDRLAVHFHDTYGQALANSLAAVECGVTTIDASAGGLGGCPFARSATGNLATEDLCWALAGLGVGTGVDLRALAATSVWMAGRLGRSSPSRVVQALASRAEEDR
ncbi:MAG: hydroxymethylglutaryl-CoA lyase [Acidimicrobiales bacterium]